MEFRKWFEDYVIVLVSTITFSLCKLGGYRASFITGFAYRIVNIPKGETYFYTVIKRAIIFRFTLLCTVLMIEDDCIYYIPGIILYKLIFIKLG